MPSKIQLEVGNMRDQVWSCQLSHNNKGYQAFKGRMKHEPREKEKRGTLAVIVGRRSLITVNIVPGGMMP